MAKYFWLVVYIYIYIYCGSQKKTHNPFFLRSKIIEMVSFRAWSNISYLVLFSVMPQTPVLREGGLIRRDVVNVLEAFPTI